jgi:hypothetical protein
MTERMEPWWRFETKVDPNRELAPAERARRAKIACRAFMRAIARKSVKTRAAKQARKKAAVQRRLARPPSDREMAEFARDRDEAIASRILWAASQRGEKGIAGLRRRQLEVREDCLLCHRPFSVEDRAAGLRGLQPGR